MKTRSLLVPTGALYLLAACSLGSNDSSEFFQLSNAFNSVPAGYDEVHSSFASTADNAGTGGPGSPWMPDGRGERGGRSPGGPGLVGLMGGGMGPGFLGDIGVGHGFGRGPFGSGADDSSCVFSVATV